MNFTQSLVAFALHQANVAENAMHGRDAKAALLRKAATMTEQQKVQADREVVGALAARFGIKAKPMEKQAKYSGMGFENGTAAYKALNRARQLLKPTAQDEAEEAVARLMQVGNASADPVASMLKRYEGLTAGQKRSFLAKLRGL